MTATEAREALATATSVRDEIRTAHRERTAAHTAALGALGTEPRVDPDPRPPTPPPQSRPTDEAVTDARALLGGSGATQAVYDRARADLDRAEAELSGLVGDAERAGARAALVRAALRAAKDVPGAAYAEQLAALGDIGPARVRFPTTGTTRAEVVYVAPDGTEQPFESASSGEQLVADVALRAGIRRAAATRYGAAWRWCPLVVDPGDYCGGAVPLPVLPAPAWVHRSSGGEEITVETSAGVQRIGRLAMLAKGAA